MPWMFLIIKGNFKDPEEERGLFLMRAVDKVWGLGVYPGSQAEVEK